MELYQIMELFRDLEPNPINKLLFDQLNITKSDLCCFIELNL